MATNSTPGARFLGVSILLGFLCPIAVPAEGQEPRRREDFSSLARLSPDGKWLVNVLSHDQVEPIPGAPPGSEQSRAIKQWIFRVRLNGKQSKVQLLHRLSGPRLQRRGALFLDSVILNNGTVLAIREDPKISIWSPKGSLKQHRLFRKGFPGALLHLRPDQKELLIFGRSSKEEYDVFNLRLEDSRLEHQPLFSRFPGIDLHWSRDLSYIFGVEEGKGNPPTLNLVRIGSKGDKRTVVETGTHVYNFYGFCFGEKLVVWNQFDQKKCHFWQANLSEPFSPRAVSKLDGWMPVLALGEDRFLLSSLDMEDHSVVDLKPGTPKERGDQSLKAEKIDLPAFLDILFSPAIDALLLSADGHSWEMWDLKGKKKGTLQFPIR